MRRLSGGLAPAFARLTEPGAERNWRRGAGGEERAAARLEKLLRGSPVTLLHDRRLPRSRANIDHVAIGPTGVTVIDTKRHAGKARVVGTRLLVDGRDRTRLVGGVQRQVTAVREALESSGLGDVPASGAICWIEVDGLPLLGSLRLDGVVIDGPRPLARMLRGPGPLERRRIAVVSASLAAVLPPRSA